MDPNPKDRICDPACGTSGFLVASGDYLRERNKKEVLLDKQNRNHFLNGLLSFFNIGSQCVNSADCLPEFH